MLDRAIRGVTDLAASTPVFVLASALCVGWLTGLVRTAGVFEPSGLDGIVTFWLGFAILRSTKSSERAIHVRLNELVRAVPDARSELAGIERLTDRELRSLDPDDPTP